MPPVQQAVTEPAENHQQSCSVCKTAMNRQAGDDNDDIDDLVDETLEDWEQVMEPVINPVRLAIEEAKSFEDMQARLVAAFEEMDLNRMVESLAEAGLISRAMGDNDA